MMINISAPYLTEFKADDLPHNHFRDIYNYWLDLRKKSEIVSMHDFDLTTMYHVIPYVAMTSIEHDPFRIQYNAIGTKLKEIYGKDISNKYIDDVFSKNIVDELDTVYHISGQQNLPLYNRRQFRNLLMRKVGYDRLLLPLSKSEKFVDHVALMIIPIGDKIRKAEDWREDQDIKKWLEDFKIEKNKPFSLKNKFINWN